MKKFILITLCIVFTFSISLNAQMVGAKYHKGDVIGKPWYQESTFQMTYKGKTELIPVKIKVQRVVCSEPTDEKYVYDAQNGIPAGSYETWEEEYTYQVMVNDPNDWEQGYCTLVPGEVPQTPKPNDKIYKAETKQIPIQPRVEYKTEYVRKGLIRED